MSVFRIRFPTYEDPGSQVSSKRTHPYTAPVDRQRSAQFPESSMMVRPARHEPGTRSSVAQGWFKIASATVHCSPSAPLFPRRALQNIEAHVIAEDTSTAHRSGVRKCMSMSRIRSLCAHVPLLASWPVRWFVVFPLRVVEGVELQRSLHHLSRPNRAFTCR